MVKAVDLEQHLIQNSALAFAGAKTPCRLWLGEYNRNGYGRIWVNGKREMAHIVSYKLHNKKFVVGRKHKWVIDHLCENRGCINPDHLQQVKESINLNRRYNRRKTV